MRFKLFLITIALLMPALAGYLALTTGPTPAAAAPPLAASEQQALISAINTLLLTDDEPETLVLLYVNGDNNLALDMQKEQLVQKIHRGATNPAITVRMVLDWPIFGNSRYYQVDRRGVADCQEDIAIDYTWCGRYQDGVNVHPFPEDLGDPANLSKFIQDGIAERPHAERIILAMVGHGGGWSPNVLAGQPKGHGGKPGNQDAELGGLLWDNSTESGFGNSLSTLDLHQALADAKSKTDRTIDLLYLDACLMGMWEVGHQVQSEVHYLLASESWSWTSFAYAAHLAAVTNDRSIEQIGAAWISNEAAVLAPVNHAYTFSLLDLTQMPTLTASIDGLAQQLELLVQSEAGKANLRNAFKNSDCFDSNADALINRTDPALGDGIDNYCDLGSFVAKVEAQFPTTAAVVNAVQAVKSAITTTVRAERSASGVPGRASTTRWEWGALGGVSIYTPLGQDDWKRGLYSQLAVATATQWDELLTAYWNAPIPTAPDCPQGGCDLPNGPLGVGHRLYLPWVGR